MGLATCAALFFGGCSYDWKIKPKIADAGPNENVDHPSDADARTGDAGGQFADSCDDNLACGDAARLYCSAGTCVEFECHVDKACTGFNVCRDHACIAFVPPERLPVGYYQTNGGGIAASARYQLRWAAGMPQPGGNLSNASHKLTIGAGAGRP